MNPGSCALKHCAVFAMLLWRELHLQDTDPSSNPSVTTYELWNHGQFLHPHRRDSKMINGDWLFHNSSRRYAFNALILHKLALRGFERSRDLLRNTQLESGESGFKLTYI